MKRPAPAADGVVEDIGAYPIAVALVACLEEEFLASGLGPACRTSVMYGAGVPFDACGCDDEGCGHTGQITVQLLGAYPSTNFPNQEAGATPCGTGLAFNFEVFATTCAPIEKGMESDAEELLAATRIQYAQMAAMRRAITCCLPGKVNKTAREVVLGNYTPAPNGGDCIGGSWTVTVAG